MTPGRGRVMGVMALSLIAVHVPAVAADVDPVVLEAESQRVAAMAKAIPPSIGIFASGQGGGSGVIISPDGYALSNFHVTSAAGVAMKCGLADGGYHDAVLVGLDPTGDVALIKLLGRDDFPAAELGDSDDVRAGDWVFAVGNPFLLATNFQPTVTYGIVSGVHRYQYPAGTLLEYADCIQTDAAINPGNSGGPLFNDRAELIGINGRGSFEKRGRVNVGVGYAISINQIKHFLGCLKGGRIVDHATLGATVTRDDDGRVLVTDILEESDAYRQGLRFDDEIIRIAGKRITSANVFKNVLGTLPKDWRVPVVYRRRDEQFEVLVQLAGVHRTGELDALAAEGAPEPPGPRPEEPRPMPPDPGEPAPPPPEPGEEDAPRDQGRGRPRPARAERRAAPQLPESVKPYYEVKAGYANYYFNRLERDRVWNAFGKHGDFSSLAGDWLLEGDLPTGGDVRIVLGDAASVCSVPAGEFGFQVTDDLSQSLDPPESGGMLAAMTLWRRLLFKGPAPYGDVSYLGAMPLDDFDQPVDVLSAIGGGVECRFYFDPVTGTMLAVEFFPTDDSPTCRLRFRQHIQVDGRQWPNVVEVTVGNAPYAVFQLQRFQVKPPEEDGT